MSTQGGKTASGTDAGGPKTEFGSGRASCRCGAVWSGFTRAHCGQGGCHRTFSGVTAFDRHRGQGVCASDSALLGIGLVKRGLLWGYPEMTEERRAAAGW